MTNKIPNSVIGTVSSVPGKVQLLTGTYRHFRIQRLPQSPYAHANSLAIVLFIDGGRQATVAHCFSL